MIFEYEKPIVEIVSFLSESHLARTDDEDRLRTTGGDSTTVPGSIPEAGDEEVGDW